jgi:hypothetical protein
VYIPPLNAFLQNLNLSAEEFDTADQVTVPASLLRFMLQLLAAGGAFNEAGYLRDNPDVAEAVEAGQIRTARLHYVGFGYFEQRRGATPQVDEAWYRSTYADVDEAIKEGQIQSASEHFFQTGAAEGRSPNARTEVHALLWKEAFGRGDEQCDL